MRIQLDYQILKSLVLNDGRLIQSANSAGYCYCLKGAILKASGEEYVPSAYNSKIGFYSERDRSLHQWVEEAPAVVAILDGAEKILMKVGGHADQEWRQKLLWDTVARLEELDAIEWVNKPVEVAEPEKVVCG